MANVISLGAPISAPEQLRRETPYQHLDTNPDMFGAAHARQNLQNEAGLERASVEGFDAWKQNQDLQNEIVADDRVNQFNSAADALLYSGQDALFKKQGLDFMNAYQGAAQQLQQLRSQYLGGLPNTTLTRVDNELRNYMQRETRMMSGRYDQATKEYGAEVNKAGIDLDLRQIAAHPGDPDIFNKYRESLRNRYTKDLQLKGLGSDADALQDAQNKADDAAWQGRVDSLLKTDPAAARKAFSEAPPGTFTGVELERYQNAFDIADAKAQRIQTKQDIADATRAIASGGTYKPPTDITSHPSGKDNFANNNYGNIKTPSGGWASYPNAESGVQAISDWLGRHYQQHGQDTIRKILDQPGDGYSPSAENPGKDLVGQAAKYTGFQPDQKLDLSDPATRVKLVRAILSQEGAPSEAFRTKAAGGPGVAQATESTPAAPQAAPAPLPTKLTSSGVTGAGSELKPTEPNQMPSGVSDAGSTPNAPNQAGVVGGAAKAPVDNLRPDFEKMEQNAYAIDNDEVRAGVLRNLQRSKAQWDLATQGERRQLSEDLKNTTDQLMAGKDVPLVSEARIRHLLPPQSVNGAMGADDVMNAMHDAQIYGQELTRVNTQSLPEIMNERARLTAAGGLPGIHDYTLRAQGADQYLKASEQVLKEMSTDPAGWMATRPELSDKAHALAQLQPPQHAEDMPAYIQAHENYANTMLAAQDHFGLPSNNQHVLAVTQATGIASKLMSDPAGAHDLMAGMQQQWGSAWPKVWNDLVTEGGLSTAYQAIGVLDQHYGQALARGLADESGGDGMKKGMQVWNDMFGRGADGSNVVQQVTASVRDKLQPFITSMSNGGASSQQQDAMLHAVSTLTFSLMAHGMPSPDGRSFGTLSQSEAIDKATGALLGLYQFMPGATGGARVPTSQFGNVQQAVASTVAQIGASNVRIPPGFGKPGQPTNDDYLNALRARPTWVNEGDGLSLIDNAGRHVLNQRGQPITVPFNVTPPMKTATASQAPTAPTMTNTGSSGL